MSVIARPYRPHFRCFLGSTQWCRAPFNRAETMRRRCSTGFQPVSAVARPYRPHFRCFLDAFQPHPFHPALLCSPSSPSCDAAPHSPTTSARIPSPRRRRRTRSRDLSGTPLLCFSSRAPNMCAAPSARVHTSVRVPTFWDQGILLCSTRWPVSALRPVAKTHVACLLTKSQDPSPLPGPSASPVPRSH